ncbi:MAG: hypothetical protein GY928_02220 [Colwellia sp.]|nr:hypothetical protein [Colwellia sp.]
MTQLEATTKVKAIKQSRDINDEELRCVLGISKPTLYKRLRNNDWKKAEIVLIKNLELWD